MLDTLVADLTDLRLWLFILIVSAVGLAEKWAIYRAGQSASKAELSSLPGINEERRVRLEGWFQTKGSWVLLLASIPGLGAAMTAVAGFVGVATSPFALWVTISLLVRNWLIVLLTGQITGLF